MPTNERPACPATRRYADEQRAQAVRLVRQQAVPDHSSSMVLRCDGRDTFT